MSTEIYRPTAAQTERLIKLIGRAMTQKWFTELANAKGNIHEVAVSYYLTKSIPHVQDIFAGGSTSAEDSALFDCLLYAAPSNGDTKSGYANTRRELTKHMNCLEKLINEYEH